MHQFSWECNQRIEALGITAASSKGTDLTGTQNNWGSLTSMGTTSFDYEGIVVSMVGASSATGRWLLDVYADNNAGTPLIDQLVMDAFRHASNDNQNLYCLPIHVAAGTTLYARIFTDAGTTTLDVALYGLAAGFGVPGASRLQCFTSVPGGPSLTGLNMVSIGGMYKTPWSVLCTSAPQGIDSLLVVPINSGTTLGGTNRWEFDLGLGSIGSEVMFAEGLAVAGSGATSDGPIRGGCTSLFPVNHIDPGSRLSFRGLSSSGTDVNVHVYGLIT